MFSELGPTNDIEHPIAAQHGKHLIE